MQTENIIVLNPTAEFRVGEIPAAPRLRQLGGKFIGLLWNNKPNGDILLAGIQKSLGELAGISGVRWQRKTTPADMANAEAIEDLVRNCDMVINAIGD